MNEEGRTSKAPLSESFGRWKNQEIVILALVGLTIGQAVIWYTGEFYDLFFLTGTLKVDLTQPSYFVAAALLIGTPFFVIRFALGQDRQKADHHGRLPDRRT
jgi:hypothetical protein